MANAIEFAKIIDSLMYYKMMVPLGFETDRLRNVLDLYSVA